MLTIIAWPGFEEGVRQNGWKGFPSDVEILHLEGRQGVYSHECTKFW